jgi:exodeoxyribonuclease VII small subunit
MAKSSSPKPVQKLTFEEAFAELEALIDALENELRPLDEAMSSFERGQALIKRCTELLDKAELKVSQLSSEGLADFSGET